MSKPATPVSDAPVQLNRKDLVSDQEVRWCPGCGDYSIVKTVQTALAKLGVPRENMVVVSGIGCAARFPYYMATYGFHSIHGRAPALATGIKMANPDLHVWVVGGDGDLMSIGGNHLLHVLRRNVDMTVLLFNNRIYGLTKGQFSPTTGLGARTKSTPSGSIDPAFDPVSVALGAGATFVARSVDTWSKHLEKIIIEAHEHKGTSFVEILQNCIIFNDAVFEADVGRKVRDDRTVDLVQGEPLIFGKERNKGLRLNGFELEVVDVAADGDRSQLIVHDAGARSAGLAHMLAAMPSDDFPVPVGVFRRVEQPTYERSMDAQVAAAKERFGGSSPSLDELLNDGDTWTVE
jgi:2-oxoglutarate ferredoxin oxidoreductase subunit beta